MNINEFMQRLSQEVSILETSGQTRSAFLVWYLVNYFRLDEDDAKFAICDSSNDKGIDGICVDEYTKEIVVLQSKYHQVAGRVGGENEVRNFLGASGWFENTETLTQLLSSTASNELKMLVSRLDLLNKVENYTKSLYFVTNKNFDANAYELIKANHPRIVGYDLDRLFQEYTYAGQAELVQESFSFSIDSGNIIRYETTGGLPAIIFPAKSLEITALSGIQDRTLFARNVRFGLGNTRVNQDISSTLNDPAEHTELFLYHNGITMVCTDFTLDTQQQKLSVNNYSIVNGCQSTLELYSKRTVLTDNAYLLFRVVQIGDNDVISGKITHRTNNQNVISMKDLKSNDIIQQSIQTEITALTNGVIFYKIKPGEEIGAAQRVVENDFIGQLITSFHLKQPYLAHQKAKNFAEHYNQMFNRHINGTYILLMLHIYDIIEENKGKIDNEGVRSYRTSRFFFMYVIRIILENDSLGAQLLEEPKEFEKQHPNYRDALSRLFKFIVVDFNQLLAQRIAENILFDYKNVLRNAQEVHRLSTDLLADHKRALIRHPEDAFTSLVTSRDQ